MRLSDSSVEALHSLGVSMAVSAHDIANISTEHFEPRFGRDSDTNAGYEASRIDIRNTPEPTEEASSQQLFAQEGHVMDKVPARRGMSDDTVYDMVNLMNNETAFTANVKALSAQEQMIGMIMDLKA